MSETPEKINHPAHYGGAKNPYEAIKVIRAWGLGFALGNAAKYICRAGRKPGEGALDDLKKARWYLDNEVEALGGVEVSKPLSNPEALLAKGRDGPGQPEPQTVEALAARVGEWRDEAQRLHEILDGLGIDPGDLRRRVEDLAGFAAQLHRAFYPGEKVVFSAGSFRYPEGRTRGQSMPAVTRVRLEAERDEAIAKLKEERERSKVWREGANRTLDEERARSQRYREKQSAAERERDGAQAGERKALAEVEKLREEVKTLRAHEPTLYMLSASKPRSGGIAKVEDAPGQAVLSWLRANLGERDKRRVLDFVREWMLSGQERITSEVAYHDGQTGSVTIKRVGREQP